MNCFSHLFTLQFTHLSVNVRFEVFQHEIHGTVPFCKVICYFSIVYGNGDGDGDGWCTGVDGDDLETSRGIAVRILRTVRDGYKYL